MLFCDERNALTCHMHTCGLGLLPLPGCCLPARAGPTRYDSGKNLCVLLNIWWPHLALSAKGRGRTTGRQWHCSGQTDTVPEARCCMLETAFSCASGQKNAKPYCQCFLQLCNFRVPLRSGLREQTGSWLAWDSVASQILQKLRNVWHVISPSLP